MFVFGSRTKTDLLEISLSYEELYMFEVSLSNEYVLLIILGVIFIGTLFFLSLCEAHTEIPGVNEPNTYGGKEKKEENINMTLLSDSINTR